jgi:hypothetical protein
MFVRGFGAASGIYWAGVKGGLGAIGEREGGMGWQAGYFMVPG